MVLEVQGLHVYVDGPSRLCSGFRAPVGSIRYEIYVVSDKTKNKNR